MESIIEISGLNKTYGSLKALNNISLNIKENIIFGFVGPDGAGKTTLIRIMCGLLKPDSGSVKILGNTLPEGMNIIKNDIGYLSQKFSLYTDLTVDENIEFIADIHGLKKFKDRRNELLQFTRLTDFRNFTAGKLSGGMKQKLALACTLIYRPKIIFLDEPTTGVDPVSRREFWIILSNLLKENITIIISTPYIDEAERFNRIALLNEGNLLCVDSPEKIRSMMVQEIISVTSSDIRKTYQILKQDLSYELQMFGDRLNIISKDKEEIKDIETLLRNAGIEVYDIRKIQPTLENAFIHLIEEDKAPAI